MEVEEERQGSVVGRSEQGRVPKTEREEKEPVVRSEEQDETG